MLDCSTHEFYEAFKKYVKDALGMEVEMSSLVYLHRPVWEVVKYRIVICAEHGWEELHEKDIEETSKEEIYENLNRILGNGK